MRLPTRRHRPLYYTPQADYSRERIAPIFHSIRSIAIAGKIQGNTQGLKPSQTKGLNRLYQRRFPASPGFSQEQARELALLSQSIGRQIGLLIDRRGRPAMVVIGDTGSILIPELPHQRVASGRLRGLRLLHTHLAHDGLTKEDLMDMLFLRLDAVTVLTVDQSGLPAFTQTAHLLPQPGTEPYDLGPLVSWDRADLDFDALVRALEDEMAREASLRETSSPEKRAMLVHVSGSPKPAQERSLDELKELARTAGVETVGVMTQRVRSIHPRHIMGKGKLSELEVQALQANAGLIIFDCELTPNQITNLADLTERKILDRTQLILDIFAQHATTRAGKLQVEMAQLEYTLPRLVGKNKALSRLMGGIGGRGPGESKLELDRRKVRDRMTRIRKELGKLRKQRASVRARRAKAGVPVAALVGYTNAGKSTLLNAMTRSEVLAENKLFATLDPTTRRLRIPEERELILTDTVGFITSLPAPLKEAFRATLEELASADLFLLVADAGHAEVEHQVGAVKDILRDMDLADTPHILVLNKWDLLDAEQRAAARSLFPEGMAVSALDGSGLADLAQAVGSHIDWEKDLTGGPYVRQEHDLKDDEAE